VRTNPKVSIVMPIFQAEPFILHCLQTLMAQTDTDFEIVAVDDCSSDRSKEIAEEFLSSQSTIPWKIIQSETNVGPAECRQIAISHSRGEYILCVDSDDFVAPNVIEVACNEAESSGADVVVFGGKCVDTNGQQLYEVASGDSTMSGMDAIAKIFDLSLQGYCWNKLFRRDLFSSVEHPRGLIYEDILVCVQAFAGARVVRLIPDQLYFYVKRTNSLSVRFNPRIVDLFEIVDRVERCTRLLPIANYEALLFRLRYVFAFRTMAFEAARQAPNYDLAAPILKRVSSSLQYGDIRKMYADNRPKLSVAMFLLKVDPRIFFRFVRRFK